MDCTHPTWAGMKWPEADRFGSGPFPRTVLPPPHPLARLERRFSRYGLPYEAVKEALRRMAPPPDLVLLSCQMTYWYPGAITAARLVRSIWPRVPVVLGGAYATLCPDHAETHQPVDWNLQGPAEQADNWRAIWSLLGAEAPAHPGSTVSPSLLRKLYPLAEFSVILGSRGCPFSCPYCASNALFPGFIQGSCSEMWPEIEAEIERGIRDFAFYDDALLVDPESWLLPLLERLRSRSEPVRLHTPNGLHVRSLSLELCRRLKSAGLTTVRLGLETADFTSRWDAKLSEEQWRSGLSNLFQAGFSPDAIGAYILFGLPGQRAEEIERAIHFAKGFGIRPHLAYYSPIPGSRLFETAKAHSPFPLAEEPLYHNRSLWPCYPGGFSWAERSRWDSILKG